MSHPSAPSHAKGTPGAPPPDPSARILAHMNADHHDSIVRYAEHYCSLSSYTARHAHLTSISFTSLTLSTKRAPATPPAPTTPGAQVERKSELSAHTYHIPLDPPLTSWAQARERLVGMDNTCLEALDRSPFTLGHYIPPRGLHAVLMVLTTLTFLTFFSRALLTPNVPSRLFGTLPMMFPSMFSFFWTIQPWVFWPMLVAHLGEAVYLDRSRLRKHGVSRGGTLWWKWVVGCVFEGFGNFVRIDTWAADMQKRKDAKAH